MAVEFWSVYNPKEAHCFAVLEDGEVVEDDGWLAGEMEVHDHYDWTDVEFLLRRYDGPSVLAVATGPDEERLRARGWAERGPPPHERRERSARSLDAPFGKRFYHEVGGDREFDAFSVYLGTNHGRYDLETSDDLDVDLILVIVETGERVPIVLGPPADDGVPGHSVDELVEELTSDRTMDRLDALRRVEALIEEQPGVALDLVPVLTDVLVDDSSTGHRLAMSCLSDLSVEYADHLVPAAGTMIDRLTIESEVGVQAEVLPFLANLADVEPGVVLEAVPTVAAIIEDATPYEEDAVLVLVRVAKTYPEVILPVVDDLVELLAIKGRDNRVAIFAAIGHVAKAYPHVAQATIPTSIDLLDAENDHLRANAAAMLADLADAYPEEIVSVVDRVIDLLDDEDEHARYNATSILAKLARVKPEAVGPASEALIDALAEEHPYSRSNACWALGYLEAEDADSRLKELAVEDPHEEVREVARWALKRM